MWTIFREISRYVLYNIRVWNIMQYSSVRGLFSWPRGVGSAASRLLRLWVRIPPGTWMFVCCECYVLSGRGLCDELITRPEESYRLWCVVVCDLETSWMRRPWPTGGCRAKNKQTKPAYTRKDSAPSTILPLWFQGLLDINSTVSSTVVEMSKELVAKLPVFPTLS